MYLSFHYPLNCASGDADDDELNSERQATDNTKMPLSAPPPMPHIDMAPIIREFLYTMFVRMWYLWPLLIAGSYLKGRSERSEEKAKTKRRVRDEIEARAEIDRENR